jgi:hypothetical protein
MKTALIKRGIKMPNYIVHLKNKDAYESCSALLHTENCMHKKINLLNAISLSTSLDIQGISKLIDPAIVQRIEEDVLINLTLPAINTTLSSGLPQLPWGISRIGAIFSRIPTRYPRPKVAVMDTGLSLHQSLSISGKHANFTTEKSAVDLNGHGTHIAGTIGGFLQRKGSFFHGVYPRISLTAVKTFTQDGTASLSSILQGIEWCIQNNIQIINMSFGLNTHQQSLLDAVMRNKKESF